MHDGSPLLRFKDENLLRRDWYERSPVSTRLVTIHSIALPVKRDCDFPRAERILLRIAVGKIDLQNEGIVFKPINPVFGERREIVGTF